MTPDARGEDKQKVYVLGDAYDFRVAKVMGYWTQSKFGDQKLGVFNLGVSVPLGRGKLRAGYVRADASDRTAAGIDITGDREPEGVAGGRISFGGAPHRGIARKHLAAPMP